MNTPQHPLPDMLAELRDQFPLKVWSVLVTILGDFAPGKGDTLSGPALAALAGRIGIRPEALRVALYRLRKDGWIDSRREGRVAHYALSASGRAETREVQGRIYGSEAVRPSGWTLVIAPPEQGDVPPPAALALGRQMFLCAQEPRLDERHLILPCADPAATGWMRDRILPPAQRDGFERLLNILARATPDAGMLAPLDRAVVRIMVLHTWRRLVLRTHPLAEAAMGPDWVGAHCRAEVAAWLERLPRMSTRDAEPAARDRGDRDEWSFTGVPH